MTDPYDVLRYGVSEPPPPIRPLGVEPTVAIAATGAYTLAFLFLCGLNLWYDNSAYISPAMAAIAWPALTFWVLSAIAAYVALCMWMQAVRQRLSEARYDVPPVWKIWAGWLIPFYSLVAPYNVMKSLRTRLVWGSGGLVRVWWATFLIANVLDRFYGTGQFRGGSSSVVLLATGALMAASFAALILVIRSTSSSLEPHAPATAF